MKELCLRGLLLNHCDRVHILATLVGLGLNELGTLTQFDMHLKY